MVRGSVCDPTSPTQRWVINRNGQVQATAGSQLCLGYDNTSAAHLGHGQALMVMPCAVAPQWLLNSTHPQGTPLQLPKPVPCVDYTGDCQCAKLVAPGHIATPNAALELWSCADVTDDGVWSYLRFDDANNEGMLSALGLCLDQQQPDLNARYADVRHRRDAPLMTSDVRINVTATNGIDNAHIMEVRLYDEEGMRPFPSKP
jgi:hypothetical protein